jgi:hypothetical protein
MSRAVKPTMVGNDVLINTHREVSPEKPVEDVRLRLAFQEPAPVHHIPYQNLGALAFNAPAMEQTHFVRPSLGSHGLRFFSRAKIKPLLLVLVLMTLMIGIIAAKQQIVRLAGSVQSDISKAVASHKTVAPIAIPGQLVIHGSDYDSAMTALMTQTITLNVGSASQAVNGATIAGWINTKHQGSLIVFSVNTTAVSSYLNQVAKAGGATSSAVKQIANNLLKAQGMTVTVPSS